MPREVQLVYLSFCNGLMLSLLTHGNVYGLRAFGWVRPTCGLVTLSILRGRLDQQSLRPMIIPAAQTELSSACSSPWYSRLRGKDMQASLHPASLLCIGLPKTSRQSGEKRRHICLHATPPLASSPRHTENTRIAKVAQHSTSLIPARRGTVCFCGASVCA